MLHTLHSSSFPFQGILEGRRVLLTFSSHPCNLRLVPCIPLKSHGEREWNGKRMENSEKNTKKYKKHFLQLSSLQLISTGYLVEMKSYKIQREMYSTINQCETDLPSGVWLGVTNHSCYFCRPGQTSENIKLKIKFTDLKMHNVFNFIWFHENLQHRRFVPLTKNPGSGTGGRGI